MTIYNKRTFEPRLVFVSFSSLITGDPGSLFVSRTGLITWVNIENIGGEVQVCKFARKWKKSMKLTMWRVVVVLNMYTKFREKYSHSPFIHSIVAKPSCTY